MAFLRYFLSKLYVMESWVLIMVSHEYSWSRQPALRSQMGIKNTHQHTCWERLTLAMARARTFQQHTIHSMQFYFFPVSIMLVPHAFRVAQTICESCTHIPLGLRETVWKLNCAQWHYDLSRCLKPEGLIQAQGNGTPWSRTRFLWWRCSASKSNPLPFCIIFRQKSYHFHVYLF